MHLAGDDVLLARLYRFARALVYPSLYEGFGIPPLEAMSAGCPVLTSNSSSLPEVVGNAGEYFDPTDEGQMAMVIDKVINSDERRRELIELGKARCAGFSWRTCAEQTKVIYERLR